GYLHAGHGIRIGICGVYSEKGMVSAGDISSLALRLPHEMKGIGAEAIESLRPFDSSILIISPPGGGKTSFLRELIRKTSEAGVRVCLCDERGEVAAMWQGVSSFDLGPMCDVLSGVEKRRGITMLLRSMNPRIIAVDEISAEYDGQAMKEALSCGAAIYATAHGKNLEELMKRPHYKQMISDGLFQKAVIISHGEKRTYEVVDL
ncbi:MAG: stage III sporulation protein AB, partial [Oscillospiraceae bacterium]|nr:stage III sporulation protein AB [Oscillospiraceae bacterium]